MTEEQNLAELKERMKLIVEADPAQYHNEYSLKRYLRAFKTVDNAFQVNHFFNPFNTSNIIVIIHFTQNIFYK